MLAGRADPPASACFHLKKTSNFFSNILWLEIGINFFKHFTREIIWWRKKNYSWHKKVRLYLWILHRMISKFHKQLFWSNQVRYQLIKVVEFWRGKNLNFETSPMSIRFFSHQNRSLWSVPWLWQKDNQVEKKNLIF